MSTSAASSVANSSLPKWQLALAVGAPVALGLGYIYYKNSSKPPTKADRARLKKENGIFKGTQISIDGDSSKSSSESTPETPLQIAQRYKNEGNDKFKMKKFDEAIKHYSDAIDVCPQKYLTELATFYQNRAAAYEQLKKYSEVKDDCTKALEFKPNYTKALLRRARTLELNNELESALEDITTACIIEGFSNQTALMSADRVLKLLGKQHAEEHLANKKFIMPSKYFIKTYISSFTKDPIFNLVDESNETEIPSHLKEVIEVLRKQKYDDVIQLCTQEIVNPDLLDESKKMELMLLRATFYQLLGKHDLAIENLDTVISNKTTAKNVKVNALIKRATLFIQLDNFEKSIADYSQAEELDPDCDDIYHHRGQFNLLLEKVSEAKADFQKAVDLNPDFGITFVQKCYADYKYALVQREISCIRTAIEDFKEAFKKFPDCVECYTLYAQLLAETQDYEKADQYFAKAIEKDPNNATVYVHRGLLHLQWNGNMEKAIELIRKAIEIDEKCEFGYETLGTIEVQRGNLEEAVELFDKALALARTSMELTHIFSLRDAAKTQVKLKKKLSPDIMLNAQNAFQLKY